MFNPSAMRSFVRFLPIFRGYRGWLGLFNVRDIR
jgi:hypothetical protein